MRHLTPLLVAAAAVLSVAPAYADLGDQLAKLLPDDGTAEDLFGHSVAISGAIAIVGTPYDDDNGIDSGSAYLFEISDPANPTQLLKLLPDDGATHHDFGVSVAISGATAIVGADRDDDNGNASGSAYLFDTASGQQIAKLLPNDGAMNDRFGISVAISGSTAIVGALLNDDNGTNSGSAYLFDISDPKNPVQIAKLLPNDGAANDQFGTSVAISGAIAIVGAYFDDDNGESSGSAYLFDSTTGRQLSKLLPDDGAEGDQFGASVAISGATAIVGVPFDDDNGSGTGSAYLFDTTTGRQIAKLLPDDGAAFDNFGNFGISVGISGATAIVGAYHTDDNGIWSGSAYLFDTAAGQQIAKLLPNDGAEFDTFGISVAISGATAIVGAPWNNDNGDLSGSAYLFDPAGAPSPGDLNCDGEINAFDIEPFLLALFEPDEYPNQYPDCDINLADINGDGSINAFDIEPFLELLFGP